MNIGAIVEYIDQQKIISAIILSEKKGKFRLLTENSREINLSEKRLSHMATDTKIDTSQSRASQIQQLKHITHVRKMLALKINIKEIWDILQDEEDEIDLETMTLFCFDPPLTSDHEAAVIRAFFNDRLYFKFSNQIFTVFTPQQVEAKKRHIRETERRERLIQSGIAWIVAMQKGETPPPPEPGVLDILKNYYLFGGDANNASAARQMVRKSGMKTPDSLFQYFVKIGTWDLHENIDLYAMDIPTRFSDNVLSEAKKICTTHANARLGTGRKNLTHLPLITIDGQSTLDYDDAISLETTEQGYRLGIHIIDVAAHVPSDSPVDLAARRRASSIYMPDDKLPMIPTTLSEDLCSLKQGAIRPAISTLVHMSRFFEVQDYEIVPSLIKVHKQMSYSEANLLNGQNDPITSLHKIATILREKRIKAGAIQITLPEVNVWIEDKNEIRYAKVDRENPSRMLVSEMMIFANALMAEFIAKNDAPAVFRSQAAPKQRLFKGIETSLLPNFMQRKHLSRAVIGTKPELHAGLGVKAYVTATSPIRRYHDLLTQRQIRAILGMGPMYSKSQLEDILTTISSPMANAGRIQGARKRYWLIKYLEAMKGKQFEGLVLDCHRDYYNILIKEFMLETRMPVSGLRLKHGDIIQVTIQHADARRNQLSLFTA